VAEVNPVNSEYEEYSFDNMTIRNIKGLEKIFAELVRIRGMAKHGAGKNLKESGP
jgi:hypothetical protein